MADTALVDRILAENPFGMSVAAQLFGVFREDRPTHPSTITRWCLHGVRLADGRALRLEHIRVGNRLLTSRPALLRFLVAQQDAGDAIEPPRSPTERRRANDRAQSELQELGVG